MFYNDIKKYFSGSEYSYSVNYSLSSIQNTESEIIIDSSLFELCIQFRKNKKLGFYIELNEFFNKYKSTDETEVMIRSLLLISASNDILIKGIQSINKSFFIIHSVANYGVKYEDISVDYEGMFNPCILLIYPTNLNGIPDVVTNYIFEHLTYMIIYAKKYSTDYAPINQIMINVISLPCINEPKLMDYLGDVAIHNPYCTDFLIQLFEWCDDNNKEGEHIIFYVLLNYIQEKTKLPENNIFIELSLFRFRENFDKDYDYSRLESFYTENYKEIDFLNRIRVLTQLFLKLDKEKYINKITEEINKKSSIEIRYLMEEVSPDTFSAYLTCLAYEKKDIYFNLLEKHYYAQKEILEATVFYIHSDDYTYILEKEAQRFEITSSLLSSLVKSINNIFNLSITVKYESELQDLVPKRRENVPTSNTKDEESFIENLIKYYHIEETNFNDNLEYILVQQHMRVPLQQLLLKKYNKLFPFIDICAKTKTKIKKVTKIIHIVLSESSTLDQEENIIKYLNTLNTDTIFEYKYIDDISTFKNVLNSDEYSVISVTSHGEVDIRDPLDNMIKIGNRYFDINDLSIDFNTLKEKRLLYLNICDSGHYALKNGLAMESFSTELINDKQAIVSNMWPVNQTYSSTFLMIFLHHLSSSNDYKESYKNTLSLAVHYLLDEYILKNDLYSGELELFRVFHDSTINKKSITNWGSMIYQE